MDGPLNKVKALNKKWKVRTLLHGGIMVIVSQAIDIFEVLTTNRLEYMIHNVIGDLIFHIVLLLILINLYNFR